MTSAPWGLQRGVTERDQEVRQGRQINSIAVDGDRLVRESAPQSKRQVDQLPARDVGQSGERERDINRLSSMILFSAARHAGARATRRMAPKSIPPPKHQHWRTTDHSTGAGTMLPRS